MKKILVGNNERDIRHVSFQKLYAFFPEFTSFSLQPPQRSPLESQSASSIRTLESWLE